MRIAALTAAGLAFLASGCVVGVAWLPDSSGFVYTTSRGQVVHYDVATKTRKTLAEDPAAAVTAWPAISPDGKRIALVNLTEQGSRLSVTLLDCDGKATFRSEPYAWGGKTSKDAEIVANVFWNAAGDALAVHGQAVPNAGDQSFDFAARFDLGTKKWQVWKDHVPATFGASPFRPDGKGLVLVSLKDRDSVGGFVWVDTQGAKRFELAGELAADLSPWLPLSGSRWDKQVGTFQERGHRIAVDTARQTAAVKPLADADRKAGGLEIVSRATLASGVEAMLLSREADDKKGPALRVAIRKPNEATMTVVVPEVRDRLRLMLPSPDGKHLAVRTWYGPRGKKGDTLHLVDANGALIDAVRIPTVSPSDGEP